LSMIFILHAEACALKNIPKLNVYISFEKM